MNITKHKETSGLLKSRLAGAARPARWLLLGAVLAASALLSGCGGSATSVSGKGPLTVAAFDAFEGSEAFYGPIVEAECYAAAYQVNTYGGLLGHKVQCTPYDSTSDPADAVPAATKLLATAKNLVLIDGPGNEEPAVDPILAPAHVMHLSNSTQPIYDHQTNPLWYRVLPSDSLAGVSEAVFLMKHGYTHAAGVFDTSSGAQTQVPSLQKTYAKLGGKMAINLALAPSSTYRTEVEKLLAAKPDAIMTELDTPQASVAFFSELEQLSNGKLPPIIATNGEVSSSPNWIQLIQKAMGAAEARRILQISSGGALEPAGYAAFKNALLKAPQKIVDRQQYLGLQYAAQGSDAIVVDLLAIDQAKTTRASAVAPLISQVVNGVPGAVTVHSYAQGAKEIAAGHHIRYVGGGGTILYNEHHNNVTQFQVLRWEGPKAGWVLVPADTITPQELQQAGS